MPEGDTIFRSARALRAWLEGREVTAAEARDASLGAARLVGARVDGVEARAKHLLIRFSTGWVLHTHMRMTGSWHVYPTGERWRKPRSQARLVLVAGDRSAVCFNAPVIELLRAGDEARHPGLAELGPDVLAGPLDLDEVARRAAARGAGVSVGELLLDQRVVSGIGNIWRCEALFAEGVNPRRPVASLERAELDALVTRAQALMRASADGRVADTRRPAVYGRRGRPCPRCGTPVTSARLGAQARVAYWCPACQPAPEAARGTGSGPARTCR